MLLEINWLSQKLPHFALIMTCTVGMKEIKGSRHTQDHFPYEVFSGHMSSLGSSG